MKRNKTRQIKVGNVLIGGQDKVIIQSMQKPRRCMEKGDPMVIDGLEVG